MIPVLIAGAVLYLLVTYVLPKKQVANKRIEKMCPPHAWVREDIKYEDGTIQCTRLVCQHCGPFSKLMGHGEV